MLQDNHTFGFAFRYKDPYNYYIFEMSNQEKGNLLLTKVLKGCVSSWQEVQTQSISNTLEVIC